METTNNNTPSPPPLDPHGIYIYSRLSDDGKRLFRKAFKQMWNYLLPKRSFISTGTVLYSYWYIDHLRIKAGLNSSELAMLIFIYEISCRGNNTIHSRHIYNGMILSHLKSVACKRTILHTLKRLGYIRRMTRDPQQSYLKRSISRQPTFIQMTPKGIGIINGMGKDLYKLLMDTSYNTLIGVNQKT
ncbi:MAG: hypothetical protein GX126_00515 [Bacteroidales bacterium]|jgi:hypothetical protein|nr:hypothetical protein [Bacteroidales bacterium]